MAIVKIYFGADGNDANDGTTRALRVQNQARIKTLVAAIGGGNTARLMGEGTIERSIGTWATPLTLLSSDTNMHGVRLSATITEDGAALPLKFCDFRISTAAGDWTDTATTTTAGTKIWVFTNAYVGTTGVRRVWAANWKTDAAFYENELWEGGANYTSTFTNIHPNLDIIPDLNTMGSCWTDFNAAGNATANLYIACVRNPVTQYGAISYVVQAQDVLVINGLTSFTIDPEVTIMGGGFTGVEIFNCGSSGAVSTFEAAILNNHPYSQPIRIGGTALNIYINPFIDPQYHQRLPYYSSDNTRHNMGSGNGIVLDFDCTTSSATGWPELGLIPSVIIGATASNGRKSVIRNQLHTGVSIGAVSTNVHKFVRISDGIEFDFSKVRYGRAFAVGSVDTKTTDVQVGKIVVYNQPTKSQLCGGPRLQCIGAKFHSSPNVGATYPTPWGSTVDQSGTSVGLSIFTSPALDDIDDILVMDNQFECQDGGMNIETSQAWIGNLYVANNVFIKSNTPGIGNATGVERILKLLFDTAANSQQKLFFRNNVAVGYTGNAVSRFQNSPALNEYTTILLALTDTTQNTGWAIFTDRAAYEAARHAGQLELLNN